MHAFRFENRRMQMRTLSRKDHVVSENEIAHSYPCLGFIHRNVVRWMTDYRRYTGRTVRHVGASHTCSVRAHVPLYTGITCCCYCCLVHMLPAGGSPDRHRARSCPSVLDARGRISFSRSVIRDENFSDGPRSTRDIFANYDRATRKKFSTLSIPAVNLVFFVFSFCEETEIFSHFLKMAIFLAFNIFSK